MGLIRYLERQSNIRRVEAATKRQDNDYGSHVKAVERLVAAATPGIQSRQDINERAMAALEKIAATMNKEA